MGAHDSRERGGEPREAREGVHGAGTETRREVLRSAGTVAAGVVGVTATDLPSLPVVPVGEHPGQPRGDRFDKFTERAKKALVLGQEEAQRFNHNYIGTEHLLLGLVREGGGVAARALSSLGVELNKVRSAVEFIIGRGDRLVIGDISLTPRAKKVIQLAVDEARLLNHNYVGTEHLLLGLVREGEGIAAGVLESLVAGRGAPAMVTRPGGPRRFREPTLATLERVRAAVLGGLSQNNRSPTSV
jgi:hypothetical protein